MLRSPYIKSLLPKTWQLSTASKLAVGVAGAVIVLQCILLIPTLWSNEQHLLRDVTNREQARVEQFLGRDSEAGLGQIKTSPELLGLRIDNVAGDTLINIGDVPTGTPALPTAGAAVAADIKREGNILLTNWKLSFRGQELPARVKLNVSEQVSGNQLLALRQMLLALIGGVLTGILSYFLAKRFFIVPIDETLDAIRESREAGGTDLPSKIEHQTSPELDRVTQEFNGLIEEQQKASRQVKVKQQYLEYAAHHDPLTHLSNRLMFEDRLKQTVEAALNEGEQFAIFLVDLDNFKFFNDQYGHLIGDKMVVEVGSRLKSMMRDIDLVARLDGDEFVVIQKNIYEKNNIEEIAQRIMNTVCAPFEYRGFTLKAAVSVGVSYFPDDVHTDQSEELVGEEIVNNAVVALQEAKICGKNQYQLFNESMRRRLTERLKLEHDLKNALASNQFEVYYQPKVNIQTRQVTGAEALVRWNHPTEGRISPEVFVPVAEEAGLIIEIGEWILRTACRQTHMLQQIGFTGLNVAVNISAVQFTDGNLLPMVSKALKDSSLEPELLELEITESAVMHDPEDVIHSLHELSRFGMRLAIDDFGTGYSSLAYLKRFPVNTLKIDRAFITDISSDNDDMAIVEAVLGLGSHFNMKIVAEGVEDEGQLQFLCDQGCDLAQGYFISRPMAIQEYIQWLETWPHGIQQTPTSKDAGDEPDSDQSEMLKRAS